MNRKVITRCIIAVVIVGYGLLVLPKHVITVIDYFSLKKQAKEIDTELKNLNGSLKSAREIDALVRNTGCNIKLCTVMDTVDSSNVKAYEGGDLEGDQSKILEYILELNNTNVTNVLSFLGGHSISYSSISLSEDELVLQIYCN